jgi:hypothetical protein
MGRYNLRWVFPINTCSHHRTSNNEQPLATHLGFCLPRCCTVKATSSCSSMCICDRNNRSSKPSSLAILHRERANKVFRKRSSWLLAHFFKFFITTRLPLHQTCTEGHRLQHEFHQAECRLHLIIIAKEPQVTYNFSSQIMSYILNTLICICMILLDNLLQCLLFIDMIDLSRTYDSTATLICNALVMFIIYP